MIKITEKLGLSYGVMTYDYYFSNEELLLVKEKKEDFSDPDNTGTLDYTKVEPAFHGEYYFSDGKLIDSQTEGQKRFADGLAEDGNKFVKMSQGNIELLKTQK